MLSAVRLLRYTSSLGAQPDGDDARPAPLNYSSSTKPQPQDDDPFRNTLELLPVAILVTNRHGDIVLANAASEKLFGYGSDELTGASADALVPGLRDAAQAALHDAASGHALRIVHGSRDVFARRKEGTEFPAEITTSRLTSHREALMLTVVIDQTERHELQRHRQELALLTRVSTLGEPAGSLAHELNQPLTAILSNAQAAQRFKAMEPIDLDELREILHDLVADNRRASEVIHPRRSTRAYPLAGRSRSHALQHRTQRFGVNHTIDLDHRPANSHFNRADGPGWLHRFRFDRGCRRDGDRRVAHDRHGTSSVVPAACSAR
ncbi:PAS domain S-box protein [Caballeronia humi]|uniref:histidine kinase n=1 Tax=Caballeronia humi TaxID=326474 RepID=A0A158J770_9BURK|nr:PAS domain S-box protein [Caballeronia humi]SAL64181.1 two-component sensor kinase [Caballeronia humi]